jgi:hypothetical protein
MSVVWFCVCCAYVICVCTDAKPRFRCVLVWLYAVPSQVCLFGFYFYVCAIVWIRIHSVQAHLCLSLRVSRWWNIFAMLSPKHIAMRTQTKVRLCVVCVIIIQSSVAECHGRPSKMQLLGCALYKEGLGFLNATRAFGKIKLFVAFCAGHILFWYSGT